jgi:hypothetical protein
LGGIILLFSSGGKENQKAIEENVECSAGRLDDYAADREFRTHLRWLEKLARKLPNRFGAPSRTRAA